MGITQAAVSGMSIATHDTFSTAVSTADPYEEDVSIADFKEEDTNQPHLVGIVVDCNEVVPLPVKFENDDMDERPNKKQRRTIEQLEKGKCAEDFCEFLCIRQRDN